MKRTLSVIGLVIIVLGIAALAANDIAYVAAVGLLAASLVPN